MWNCFSLSFALFLLIRVHRLTVLWFTWSSALSLGVIHTRCLYRLEFVIRKKLSSRWVLYYHPYWRFIYLCWNRPSTVNKGVLAGMLSLAEQHLGRWQPRLWSAPVSDFYSRKFRGDPAFSTLEFTRTHVWYILQNSGSMEILGMTCYPLKTFVRTELNARRRSIVVLLSTSVPNRPSCPALSPTTPVTLLTLWWVNAILNALFLWQSN